MTAGGERAGRYGELFDHALDAIACGELVSGPPHPDFRIVEVNAAFERLTGRRHVEGRLVSELLPALDPELLELLGHVVATGTPRRFERYVPTIDRRVRGAAYRPSPGLVVVTFDVARDPEAARAPADRSLQESEERFRQLADAAPVLIWTAGPDMGCDYLNATWLAFTGRTLAEERGDGWTRGIHPDDVAACLADFHDAFGARRPLTTEYRLRRADGAYRWILDTGVPRFTTGGDFAGYIGTCLDITPIREAEAQVREREAWLRAIFEASPLGISRSDPAGQFLDVNPAMATILGWPADELIGAKIRDVLHPEDRDAVLAARRALLDGQVDRLDLVSRVVRRDGATRWVALHVQPIRDADGRSRFHFAMIEDITERRHVEDELRRVLREQEILLESANVGIVLTVDRRMVAVNRWVEETFGYGRAELLGQPARVLYRSQEEYDALGAQAGPALATGEAFETERMLVCKDGSARWIHYNGRLIDPADAAKGTLWVLSDQTEQRRALAAVRASEARFRALFEGSAAVMLLVDPADGAIVDANPAAAAFYGHSRDTLRTMRVFDYAVLPPDELRHAFDDAAGRRRTKFQASHRLADGTLRQVEVLSSPVEVDGRRLLFSILQDVTERERVHAALLRERQRYQSLMAIAQDGIHVVTQDGLLVEANDAFLRSVGLSRAAVGIARVHDWNVGFAPDEIVPTIRELLAAPGVFQTRHRRPDGRVFDVEISAGAVEIEGVRYLLAASRDITARKELERQLEERIAAAVAELRAKDQLLVTQARQAAMGEMIGNIAHQWRQPLNALGLVLTNLRDAARYDDLDAAGVERAVAEGAALIRKMSSTINVFSNFFRPEKEKHPFSARQEVADTIGLIDASFRNAGIEISVEDGPDVTLFGFANEYAQALLNLLGNARQAIEGAGGARRAVTLRIGTRDGFGYVAVRDTGGGIPPAVMERLFEPYFSTKEGGMGIGLYMSRQIVERSMGGRIEVANVEGGAELTLLTPLAPR